MHTYIQACAETWWAAVLANFRSARIRCEGLSARACVKNLIENSRDAPNLLESSVYVKTALAEDFATGLWEQRLLQRLGAPNLLENSVYVKAATFQQGCGNSGFCKDLVHQVYLKAAFT